MYAVYPEDEKPRNYAKELEDLLSNLSLDPESEQIVSEIGVLQSIYGEDSIRIWKISGSESKSGGASDKTVRYEVHLDLPPPHDSVETQLKILVSLPPTYPSSTPPQLQLLSRYIGSFRVDSALFGSILRTYISSSGVEWLADTICVFDGLENVRELCANWYSERLTEEKAHDLLREDEKEGSNERSHSKDYHSGSDEEDTVEPQAFLPEDINIVVAEPIVDRKSVFIGRACKLSHPSQVPIILSHLMSNKRIARAAHPIINAWRCKVNGRLHQDNDDDGESAAGGRIAHLLQILDLEDVLVVVTRYWGGSLLGPDRFKHINRAARDALDLGGFLDAQDDRKAPSKHKKRN
ncbi:UPF0029-domain-containing protein [Phellopilus nigrolimitatus]|nr:UPF0029-domain-containing protein [Phellopilus nigrolimitatus]